MFTQGKFKSQTVLKIAYNPPCGASSPGRLSRNQIGGTLMDALTVSAVCETLLVVIGLISLLLMVGKECERL